MHTLVQCSPLHQDVWLSNGFTVYIVGPSRTANVWNFGRTCTIMLMSINYCTLTCCFFITGKRLSMVDACLNLSLKYLNEELKFFHTGSGVAHHNTTWCRILCRVIKKVTRSIRLHIFQLVIILHRRKFTHLFDIHILIYVHLPQYLWEM